MKSIIKKYVPSSIYIFILRLIMGNFCYFINLFPIKKNKIVISNYMGKGFGDNGKYIVQNLMNDKHKYDIVWLLKKELMGKSDFPDEVRIVKYKSLRGLYELATARIWIDNCRKVFYPPKRKGQYYIQTWHGGIALKQVEKDAENALSKHYIKFAKADSKMADLFLSNSAFCTNMYKNSFWFNGEILEIGSPRCDILIQENNNAKTNVLSKLKIDKNKKIILYAPTFRADHNVEIYNVDFNKMILALKRKFGGEWIFLVRLHPIITHKSGIINYDDYVINASYYDDMYELLSCCDILITDYSSTMFEFSLTKKPVFLYTPDISEYMKDRNFYFDLYSLPYSVSLNNEELIKNIELFDSEKYTDRISVFNEHLGITEKGNSSIEVSRVIRDVVYG